MKLLILDDMEINSENLNKLLNGLKSLYETEKVKEKRRQYIVELVNNYGYIPYPHIKALNEFSEAETIIALEEKLKLNNNYKEEKFVFDKNTVSPVKKADFQDSDWLLKEQHNIKLINLAAIVLWLVSFILNTIPCPLEVSNYHWR